MCTAFRTSDDHWPERLAGVIRTFLSPGCFHVCVKVGVVTVESTRSSWKSYQCQVLGSFVLWSVSVTCWPAVGCIRSGDPVSGPVGPQVKSATGGPVWVQAPSTTICRVVVLDPLQFVAVSVTVYVPA